MRSFLELRKRKITTSYSPASHESVVLGRVYLEKLDSKSPLEIFDVAQTVQSNKKLFIFQNELQAEVDSLREFLAKEKEKTTGKRTSLKS